MCRAVKCTSCGKTTWAGCGAHVDQVMASVSEKDRCQCKAPKSESLIGQIVRKLSGG